MLTLPKIIERPAQPYAGIRGRMPMSGIPAFADKAFPAIMAWAKVTGVTPTGAPFFKYNLIDMAGEMELECGIPVSGPVEVDHDMVTGVLPAGQYASVTYTGSYDALYDVNAVLIGWAKEKGIVWDAEETPAGDRFACRLEVYETDPVVESDPSKWVTEVAIRIAD